MLFKEFEKEILKACKSARHYLYRFDHSNINLFAKDSDATFNLLNSKPVSDGDQEPKDSNAEAQEDQSETHKRLKETE